MAPVIENKQLMLTKKIRPKESAFFYYPKIKELYFVSELKFRFNKDSYQFDLDQNPHGEPIPTVIQNIRTNDDFSEFSFEADYRRKETRFFLSSDYNCDKLIYRTLVTINNSNFEFTQDDLDKIQLVFSNGVVSRIYFYKHIDSKLTDSLAITLDGNSLHLIKQNPWSKTRLIDIIIEEDNVVCKSEVGNTLYHLNSQPFISDLIKNLIRENFPAQSK